MNGRNRNFRARGRPRRRLPTRPRNPSPAEIAERANLADLLAWKHAGFSIPADEPDLDRFDRSRNPSHSDPEGIDQRPTWRAPR